MGDDPPRLGAHLSGAEAAAAPNIEGGSTFGVTHPERDAGPERMRIHRAVYAATCCVLWVLVLAAVADVWWPVLGVDSATVVARGDGGIELRVEYPEVTRPALASPFAVEVRRPGGFDGPIELAISRPWIEVWDENGTSPSPDAETGDPDWVVYEFDPPDGDVFRLFYDARLEPARQESISGAVECREHGTAVAVVHFTTRVRP